MIYEGSPRSFRESVVKMFLGLSGRIESDTGYYLHRGRKSRFSFRFTSIPVQTYGSLDAVNEWTLKRKTWLSFWLHRLAAIHQGWARKSPGKQSPASGWVPICFWWCYTLCQWHILSVRLGAPLSCCSGADLCAEGPCFLSSSPHHSCCFVPWCFFNITPPPPHPRTSIQFPSCWVVALGGSLICWE